MIVDPADLPVPDDGFYQRYLETCRRLGVAPVSVERARELVGEWNRTLGAARVGRVDRAQRTH